MSRTLIAIVGLISGLSCFGQLLPVQQPILYQLSGLGPTSWDGMSLYANFATLNSLNGLPIPPVQLVGGKSWNGAYVDHGSPFGVIASDAMTFYSNSSALSGLNGPQGWNGAYVDHPEALPDRTWDTMASYSNGNSLTGLNGGANDGTAAGVVWNGAYVAH